MNKNHYENYYEIEFDHEPRAREWSDESIGDYSICIIGKRKPTIKEAEEFCKKDMEQMGYEYVVAVREIDSNEAHMFFDMTQEEKFPVFG